MASEDPPNGAGQTGVLGSTSYDDDPDEMLESTLDDGEGFEDEDDGGDPVAAIVPDGFAPAGYDLDEDDDEDDEGDEIGDGWAAAGVPVAVSGAVEQRQEDVDRAIAALAATHVKQERSRVRRKVQAATASAGAGGAIPLVLQLAGALNVSPEIAATLSTVVGLLAALIGGYFTPERQPALPDDVAYALIRRPRAHARQRAAHRRKNHG